MFSMMKMFQFGYVSSKALRLNSTIARFCSSTSTIPGDFKDKEAYEETRYIREMEKEMMLEYKMKHEAEMKRQKNVSSAPHINEKEPVTKGKKSSA